MALFNQDDDCDININEILNDTTQDKHRYNICHCMPDGTIMTILNNELVCPKCKSIISNNVITIEENFIMINKQSQKEERNFDLYWKPIIGQEDNWSIKNISDDELARIQAYLEILNFNGPRIQNLTAERFRNILKNDLNMKTIIISHSTKLMLYLGYKLPYTPTKEDHDFIFRKFSEFMLAYEQENVADPDRSNNMAKLFYIYRIIQTFYPITHGIQKLLPFIKLNHKSTLKNNDMIWEKLCKKLDVTYKPI